MYEGLFFLEQGWNDLFFLSNSDNLLTNYNI
jgi:hypothetical protein